MRTISDHLGAWIVVGALALALTAIWGNDAPARAYAGMDQEVCSHDIVAGVTLPHSRTWNPNPVLAGIPVESAPAATSYDLAEERGLVRLEETGVRPMILLAAYEDSRTNLKPIRMC